MAEPITFAIDISHHQDKKLSLAQARADGCELCLMKAGEGGSMVDPDFASNLAEAREAGQIVAAYWFIRANATPAQHMALIRATVPKDVALVPDVETAADGSKPTLAHARAVLDAMRAEYHVPLGYIPLWYWRDVWGRPSLAGWPPLWSSRYPDNVVGTLADEWADVPASYWDGYGGLGVGLLQFTSSARIAGYQPLDASAFRGTRAQLAAALSGTTTPTSEEDDDMSFGTPATAGTNEHVDLAVVGCSRLRIHTSFGHVVHVRAILFYKDTGTNPKGDGTGGGYGGEFRTPKEHWDWQPNRPGPIAIPSGATTCTVLYDADHPFYVSAAAQ